MGTTKLFEKHFGDTASVDMKHKNVEKFFSDLNDECLEEDKHKKCNLACVTIRKAKEYAEFCVTCDRKGLPLLSLEDYLNHY